MTIVDTPIWSLALRRRRTDLGRTERRLVGEWERLVNEGGAVLVGPVRQEILSGVRDEAAWERLRLALRPFPDVPIGADDYETAARFFNVCRSRGVTGSAIDLLICALAHRIDAPVYTTDADFRGYARVLGLRLHVTQSQGKARYSGSVTPDPPISFGMSFIFGSPSRTGSTDSW